MMFVIILQIFIWFREDIRGGDYVTNSIITSHALARELLERPDDFIFVMHDEKEYVIKSIKRVRTHANIDDTVMHWVLQLDEREGGNIVKGGDW